MWAKPVEHFVDGLSVRIEGDACKVELSCRDRRTDALYAFVIERLTERPEVADVNTSVVYEHLRNFVIQPIVAGR